MSDRAMQMLESAGYSPRFVGETHVVDPKQEILTAIGDVPASFTMLGARLLVAIYVRPEKTAGGVIRPGAHRDEDKWQGKVGLVLRIGPLAFAEDETHRWGAHVPKIGDWVMYRVGDTFPFRLGSDPNSRHLRIVEDVMVHAILDRPDVAW